MITDTTKKRQDLITDLIRSDVIYITMYGQHKSRDKVICIKTKEIYKFVFEWDTRGPAFLYIWGWPGPDFNAYLIDDYGETWAFTAEELMTKGEE